MRTDVESNTRHAHSACLVLERYYLRVVLFNSYEKQILLSPFIDTAIPLFYHIERTNVR